jgi:hypothetical protein
MDIIKNYYDNGKIIHFNYGFYSDLIFISQNIQDKSCYLKQHKIIFVLFEEEKGITLE